LDNFPDTRRIFCRFVNRAGISFYVIDILLGYCSDLDGVLQLGLQLFNNRVVAL
jgi:hypothetical protein